MRSSLRVFLLLTVVISAFRVAEATEEVQKLEQIKEEIANRRKSRQEALAARGVVFAPMKVSAAWLKEKRSLQIKDEALALCGQTFATVTQKEVMLSGRLARTVISLDLKSATAEEAQAAFRTALKAHGIAVVPIGTRILALVAADELTDSKSAPQAATGTNDR